MIKIVCPSKGRWDNVFSKKLFPNLILVVPNNEVENYKLSNPELEIIGHDEIGIVNTRRFIINKFEEFYSVDDDIIEAVKNYKLKKEVCSVDDINDFIQEDYFIAKEIGAKLFGTRQFINPVEYDGFNIFKNNCYIDPSGCGFIKGHGLNYSKSIEEGEDYFIVLQNAYINRYLLADLRYSYITVKPFKNKGGCQDIRTTETMIRDTKYLIDMFGSDVVKFKRKYHLKKNINRGERSISIPF